ncbi:hypothetical protein F5X98DRAFT_389383 [Xylaria grammica]|nr:hypothetical protein F5X98DRAFT_389383 [Xylaria grammica]
MAPGGSNPWPGALTQPDAAGGRRVIRITKEAKSGTCDVNKGILGGKSSIDRMLHPSGYKRPQKDGSTESGREELSNRPREGNKHFTIHLPPSFHETTTAGFNGMIEK